MKKNYFWVFIVLFFASIAPAQFELIKNLGQHCRYVNNDNNIASIKFVPYGLVRGADTSPTFVSKGYWGGIHTRTGHVGHKYSTADGSLVSKYGVDLNNMSGGADSCFHCIYLDNQEHFITGRGNFILLNKWKKFHVDNTDHEYQIVYYLKNPVTSTESIPTGTDFFNFEPKLESVITYPDYDVLVEMSHKGDYLVANNSLYNFPSKNVICKLSSDNLRFSRNDKMVASFTHSDITVFRTDSGAQIRTIRVPLHAKIKEIVFTHDNTAILAICKAESSRFQNSKEVVFENLSPGDTIAGEDFYFISEFNLKKNTTKHRKINYSCDFNSGLDYLDIDPKKRFISVGNHIYSYQNLAMIFKAQRGKRAINYKQFSSDGTRFLCGGCLYKIYEDSSQMQDLFK